KIARDTFNATNRPYVGVNFITLSYASSDSAGHPKFEQTPTSGADVVAINIRADIKNFGPVPGRNFRADWKVFFGGKEEPGDKKIPDTPSTIYPTQSAYLEMIIRGEEYKALAAGKQLKLDITVEYDGPSGHYKECQEHQYAHTAYAFMMLGDCPKETNRPITQ